MWRVNFDNYDLLGKTWEKIVEIIGKCWKMWDMF